MFNKILRFVFCLLFLVFVIFILGSNSFSGFVIIILFRIVGFDYLILVVLIYVDEVFLLLYLSLFEGGVKFILFNFLCLK